MNDALEQRTIERINYYSRCFQSGKLIRPGGRWLVIDLFALTEHCDTILHSIPGLSREHLHQPIVGVAPPRSLRSIADNYAAASQRTHKHLPLFDTHNEQDVALLTERYRHFTTALANGWPFKPQRGRGWLVRDLVLLSEFGVMVMQGQATPNETLFMQPVVEYLKA